MSHPIHQKKGKSTHQLMALPAEDNIIRVRRYLGKGFPRFWVDWAGRHRPPMERAFIRAGKTIKNVAREKQSIFFQRVGLLLPLGEMYLKGVKNLGLFA